MDSFIDRGYHWHEDTGFLDLENDVRTFRRGAKVMPDVEPWTIQAPEGPREAWLDADNQEYFRTPGQDYTGRGWRRMYVERP